MKFLTWGAMPSRSAALMRANSFAISWALRFISPRFGRTRLGNGIEIERSRDLDEFSLRFPKALDRPKFGLCRTRRLMLATRCLASGFRTRSPAGAMPRRWA
jgi:hypothetical protein